MVFSRFVFCVLYLPPDVEAAAASDEKVPGCWLTPQLLLVPHKGRWLIKIVHHQCTARHWERLSLQGSASCCNTDYQMFQRKAIVWFAAAKDKARFAFGFNILSHFSCALIWWHLLEWELPQTNLKSKHQSSLFWESLGIFRQCIALQCIWIWGLGTGGVGIIKY